jgi:hypothetical protein
MLDLADPTDRKILREHLVRVRDHLRALRAGPELLTALGLPPSADWNAIAAEMPAIVAKLNERISALDRSQTQ